MAKKTPRLTSPSDEAAIDDLEAAIVRAADQHVIFHAMPAKDADAHRRAAEAQARAVCDRLRVDHRARKGRTS